MSACAGTGEPPEETTASVPQDDVTGAEVQGRSSGDGPDVHGSPGDVRGVQEWVRTGQLRAAHYGTMWRISHADLEAFVAEASAPKPQGEAE